MNSPIQWGVISGSWVPYVIHVSSDRSNNLKIELRRAVDSKLIWWLTLTSITLYKTFSSLCDFPLILSSGGHLLLP